MSLQATSGVTRAQLCCRRMEEVQRSEKRATLEDIMYASVLEKFLQLGVDMLGSMDLVQVPCYASGTVCPPADACACAYQGLPQIRHVML